MKKLAFAVLGALALSTIAFAGDPPLANGSPGTCSNPLPITSAGGAHDVVTVNTCDFGNELAVMGGTGSETNDVIISYVSQGANATINVAGNANAAVFLMPACQSSTDPIAFGFAGTDMAVDSSNSPDGSTVFFNATYDATAGADLCGPITLTVTGTLPVELKSFSID